MRISDWSSDVCSSDLGVFSVGGYTVTTTDLLVIFAAIAMMVGLDQFVRRSKLGRGIRATAQDPETAALMGVNSTRVRSDERRVGKDCGSTCRSWWSPETETKIIQYEQNTYI